MAYFHTCVSHSRSTQCVALWRYNILLWKLVLLPWKYAYFYGFWNQGDRRASGGSCGGLGTFLNLVGGSRARNMKDPLPGQGIKREQGSKELGGIFLGRPIIYGSLNNFHGSKSNVYGGTFADESLHGSCWEVPRNLFLFFMEVDTEVNPTSMKGKITLM